MPYQRHTVKAAQIGPIERFDFERTISFRGIEEGHATVMSGAGDGDHVSPVRSSVTSSRSVGGTQLLDLAPGAGTGRRGGITNMNVGAANVFCDVEHQGRPANVPIDWPRTTLAKNAGQNNVRGTFKLE